MLRKLLCAAALVAVAVTGVHAEGVDELLRVLRSL